MRGRKRLVLRVCDQEVMHEFWLADIHDTGIISLDLLTRWGARAVRSLHSPWPCVCRLSFP